jgi:large subunit ribosomal protein L10
MNKEQKAAVIEEVAAQIQGAEAVFAVDYRGISVPQAAELRQKLTEAGAAFRIVKNTLTERAADEAGATELKELLEGPTAFTFVSPDGGDVALAAKALAAFRREHDVLEFKGGVMSGAPITAEELLTLSRLPAREVLHQQFVGMVAAPITGLVRGLNALIAGLAIQLSQIAEQGLVAPAPEEAPPAEASEADESEVGGRQSAEEEAKPAAEAPAEEPEAEAAEPKAEAPQEPEQQEPEQQEPEAEEPEAEAAETETEPHDTPSEGDEEKEG